MHNHLKNQTSPYLLQHAENPVDWYPWCDEAFQRAKAEDKPIFLSIGYSTCHWCHVMAHESFEDEQVAELLNQYFISIKVDKEERPDIDSIYMSVCQMLTGSGGWPTTVFLTPEQKPFYAGTYFPKSAGYGRMGLMELLQAVQEGWKTNRFALLQSADEIIAILNKKELADNRVRKDARKEPVEEQLIRTAFEYYKRSFDKKYGGFGRAPKFPTPHNLLFLMRYYESSGDEEALKMVEKTLLQMYRGGIFDHIGGGFSRYSTDNYFLVPHFEKMLYDNALLILAYCKAYELTKKQIYCQVAERTANYILREMTATEGGFYSAQDADSEGVEGKYYLFESWEITELLGEKPGEEFNQYFDITERGNFEGKNIPNLLRNDEIKEDYNTQLEKLYKYRKDRYSLHLDDKILSSWNGLMIAAMCHLYRVTGNKRYMEAAKGAQKFICSKLCENGAIHVSYREGQRSGKGFLDDYANEIFALLALYGATLDKLYLKKAKEFCDRSIADFYDRNHGGFFLYGKENEQLILRPKETYDGAVFSGNSAMAYNLVQLSLLTGEKLYEELAESQLSFMCKEAQEYPAGHAMFLVALLNSMEPSEKVTIVLKDGEMPVDLPGKLSLDAVVCVLEEPTKEYPLKDDRTTLYVCRGRTCLPPVNV